MHKHIYASGFLYSSVSEKILLHNTSSSANISFNLFSKKCSESADIKLAFQKIIYEEIGITIPISLITHVYDYHHEETHVNQSIFYSNISELDSEDKFKISGTTEWFTSKQLTKLKLPKQISHDIMIGQRVIRANSTEQ